MNGDFAQWLKERSDAQGFSNQAELAQALGVSQGTVSRWMKGNPDRPGSLPQVENLRPLSVALNVPLLELYVRVGFISPDEISLEPPERDPPDPREVRLRKVLHKIDALPAERRLIAEGVLASVDAILGSLERITEPLPGRLVPRT